MAGMADPAHLQHDRRCPGEAHSQGGPKYRPPLVGKYPADSIVANPGIQTGPNKRQQHREMVVWNHLGAQVYPEFLVEVEFTEAEGVC